MTREELLELRSLMSIAHHIPGRLRLRLDPRIRQHPAAGALENLTKHNPDSPLTGVRINPMARSLVLGYDAERIDPAMLEEFLTSGNMERVNAVADDVATMFGIQLPT